MKRCSIHKNLCSFSSPSSRQIQEKFHIQNTNTPFHLFSSPRNQYTLSPHNASLISMEKYSFVSSVQRSSFHTSNGIIRASKNQNTEDHTFNKRSNTHAGTRIMVHNIDWDMKDEVLQEFQNVGTSQLFDPENVELQQEKERGRFFLEYENAEDAAAAIRQLQNARFGSRNIEIVLYDTSRHSYTRSSANNRGRKKFSPTIKGMPTVVLMNLPFDMDESTLKLFLQDVSGARDDEILEVYLARNSDGRSRGFAYAVFQKQELCDSIIREVDNMELKEGLCVTVSPWKDDRYMQAGSK